MQDLTLTLLSHDWAGLLPAALLIVAGALTWRRTVRRGRRPIVSGFVLGLGALLAIGSLYHLVHMARVRAAHPPPGELVDVGGYRLHVLSAGEGRGLPPVVWMPGGHGAGYYLHHLHRDMSAHARSILIDRPGTGWSDIGPFPRSTAIEANEIATVLERSGERGPFVLVGHSFGGLLVANVARRRPDLVAAVVLLDATPPDAINYAPLNPFLERMRSDAALNVVQRLFGIHGGLEERWREESTVLDERRIMGLVRQELGEALTTLRALEDGARSHAASASIFAELSPGGLGWDAVVYDRELGDVPVYLVAPGAMPEFSDTAAGMKSEDGRNSLQDRDTQRLMRFYAQARERYMASSARATRIVAPAGTGHNFPYERPDFVVATVRGVLADLGGAP